MNSISRIEFADLNDGENLIIRQYDCEDELTDEILMDRNIALQLAYEIIDIFEDKE